MKKIIPFFILFLSFNSLIFAQEISPIQIQAIEKQAFSFIERYNKLLNFIGDTTNKNSDYLNLAKEFFVVTKIGIIYGNDVDPSSMRNNYTVEDFHNYIVMWYQEGISFEIKEMKLLKIRLEQNEALVEIYVKRRIKVPTRNYKRDSKLVFIIQLQSIDNQLFTNIKIAEIAKYEGGKY